MATETIIHCDLCKNVIAPFPKHAPVTVPIVFTTEQTEGRPITPHLTLENLDVCATCMAKIVEKNPVRASGAMGANTYWWRNS